MKKFLPLISFVIVHSHCSAQMENKLDVQGHRGCRGLMPENTIPAFIKAVELGVTTLEMDVVITKDKKVLVSHEPWLNSEICFDMNGNKIKKSDEKSFNIYKMNYDEISRCDCGSRFYSRFPEQQKIKVTKPLLEDVIDSVENYCNAHNLPHPFYNIETKCTPKGDLIFHPKPDEFTDLLVEVIKREKIENRSNIQSFDTRTLQYARKKFPEIHLALLIANIFSAEKNLTKLGFVPDIYSPAKELVSKKLVKFCKEKNMKLVVWTVNEKEKMKKLVESGANEIITDYPDRAIEWMKNK